MKSGNEYLDDITGFHCPYCGGALVTTREAEVRRVHHQGSHLEFNDLLLDKLRGWEVGLDVDRWLQWLHARHDTVHTIRARVRYGMVTDGHRLPGLR